jgi:hypothetical protein
MDAYSTNLNSCEHCQSQNLRFYSASFGKMPVKKYAQCLDCAWSVELKRQKPPIHYDQKLQPWDVIEAWNLDFWEGNAVKYICRSGKKEGNTAVEDYKKAITYLEECVRRAENA